ncbi:hypothetical protein NC651_028374 [Populus alba x Populus x berolinensis]|nr:hypothetical protein NC651_028374 [Populus alba x Populus x berolinensis]
MMVRVLVLRVGWIQAFSGSRPCCLSPLLSVSLLPVFSFFSMSPAFSVSSPCFCLCPGSPPWILLTFFLLFLSPRDEEQRTVLASPFKFGSGFFLLWLSSPGFSLSSLLVFPPTFPWFSSAPLGFLALFCSAFFLLLALFFGLISSCPGSPLPPWFFFSRFLLCSAFYRARDLRKPSPPRPGSWQKTWSRFGSDAL